MKPCGSVAAARLTASGASVPLADSAAVFVPAAVYTLTLPLAAPAVVGANCVVMVHDAPAASDEPQVVDASEKPVPLTV